MLCLYSTSAQVTNKLFDGVVLLSKAGITNSLIINEYVDTFTNQYIINATNIVYLKQSNVPDDVIIHLISKTKIIPVTNGIVYVKELDPESYDFFYRYYLLPRAMTYSNRVLFPYRIR